MRLVRTTLLVILGQVLLLPACGKHFGKHAERRHREDQDISHTMVISGGGTPDGNHYSQYLQTSLLSADLKGRDADSAFSVHFAAGNNDKDEVSLFDVHRIVAPIKVR